MVAGVVVAELARAHRLIFDHYGHNATSTVNITRQPSAHNQKLSVAIQFSGLGSSNIQSLSGSSRSNRRPSEAVEYAETEYAALPAFRGLCCGVSLG